MPCLELIPSCRHSSRTSTLRPPSPRRRFSRRSTSTTRIAVPTVDRGTSPIRSSSSVRGSSCVTSTASTDYQDECGNALSRQLWLSRCFSRNFRVHSSCSPVTQGERPCPLDSKECVGLIAFEKVRPSSVRVALVSLKAWKHVEMAAASRVSASELSLLTGLAGIHRLTRLLSRLMPLREFRPFFSSGRSMSAHSSTAHLPLSFIIGR